MNVNGNKKIFPLYHNTPPFIFTSSKYPHNPSQKMETRDPPPSLPEIGKTYQILTPLAQGKFGNVFLGKIKKTDETIIVKQGNTPLPPQIPKPKNSGGTAAVETIRHEAEILSFLNQDVSCRKHIPFVHWYGLCSRGIYCIAMSYIPTAPLRPFSLSPVDNATIPGNALEYEQTLQHMLRDIVQALKAIHQKGVIHRDLKPENVLYHQSKRRWYLIDFGLATFYQDEDGNHKSPTTPPRKHLVGTPNFVSCFIHEGQEPSRRDDLIALGHVAWWLRNGGSWSPQTTAPLSWEQTVEMKKQIVQEPILLEKNPENMFQIKTLTFLKKIYTLGYTDTPPYDMISKFFS